MLYSIQNSDGNVLGGGRLPSGEGLDVEAWREKLEEGLAEDPFVSSVFVAPLVTQEGPVDRVVVQIDSSVEDLTVGYVTDVAAYLAINTSEEDL